MATQIHYGQGKWPEASGYRALGDLMGGYPEMAMFRRFRNAGALDLIYRQIELQHLIQDWAITAEIDQQIQGPRRPQDPERNEFDRKFNELRRSIYSEEPGVGNQWRRWSEISEKLGAYYDRMFSFQKICSLPCADKDHLAQLRQHLEHLDKGANFLQGVEEFIYGKLNEGDLTSIATLDEPDFFTKLARGPIVNLLHKVFGRNSHHVIEVPRLTNNTLFRLSFKDYSPHAAILFSRALYAVLTSICVTVAIVSLNEVEHIVGRIVLITVHNLAFTVAMALLVNTRPGELFGVAAAYAAVLVVYASGSTGRDAVSNSPQS